MKRKIKPCKNDDGSRNIFKGVVDCDFTFSHFK